MEISIEDKVKIASEFLLSSPPGEVNDVFNDIRTLVDNDTALESGILNTLEEYNTTQLITVTLPDLDYEVIVSKYNTLQDNRYLDPRSQKSFQFDHIRLIASDVKEHTVEPAIEDLRVAVEKEALGYVYNHYSNGVCSVYGVNEHQVAIAIVDNKYNPNNYWNGRWLATWTYDCETGELKGATKVQVHYYEDGNVQLNSEKTTESTVSSHQVSVPMLLLMNLFLPFFRMWWIQQKPS
ncbi:F-actin-capping protein subunit alpha [Spinellus fusiger]|nr:F-actin-capping protein subunit alpha [Spinellus fusiger]